MKRAALTRFTAKYQVDASSGCWWWTAARTPDGYGVFTGADGKYVRAHRWSYEHFVGPIPTGLELDHLCRVRHCVNPAHLEAVTPRENRRRGTGPAAMNAVKTHCIRGHPFEGRNLYLWRGHRLCRTCQVNHTRDWRARRKQEADRAG